MKIKIVITSFFLVVLIVACSSDVNEERLLWVSSLFTGEEQHQNFNRAYKIFPTSKLLPSSRPLVFEKGTHLNLPSNFIFKDKVVNVDEYLSRTDTSALLIIKDGKIS